MNVLSTYTIALVMKFALTMTGDSNALATTIRSVFVPTMLTSATQMRHAFPIKRKNEVTDVNAKPVTTETETSNMLLKFSADENDLVSFFHLTMFLI